MSDDNSTKKIIFTRPPLKSPLPVKKVKKIDNLEVDLSDPNNPLADIDFIQFLNIPDFNKATFWSFEKCWGICFKDVDVNDSAGWTFNKCQANYRYDKNQAMMVPSEKYMKYGKPMSKEISARLKELHDSYYHE